MTSSAPGGRKDLKPGRQIVRCRQCECIQKKQEGFKIVGVQGSKTRGEQIRGSQFAQGMQGLANKSPLEVEIDPK